MSGILFPTIEVTKFDHLQRIELFGHEGPSPSSVDALYRLGQECLLVTALADPQELMHMYQANGLTSFKNESLRVSHVTNREKVFASYKQARGMPDAMIGPQLSQDGYILAGTAALWFARPTI